MEAVGGGFQLVNDFHKDRLQVELSVDRKARELRQGYRLGGCFDNIAFKKGKHPEMGRRDRCKGCQRERIL